MIGRVPMTTTCPRCGLKLVLIESEVVTSGGLIDRLLACPGPHCPLVWAGFKSRYDRDHAPADDDFAAEVAAVVARWRRRERNLEALRLGAAPKKEDDDD